MALPIWAYYMKKVYSEGNKLGVRSSDKFEKPEGIEKKWDCSSQNGFYNFGDMRSFGERNVDNAGERGERSVNEVLSSEDTISFE